MHTIRTYNKISEKGLGLFPKDKYVVSDSAEDPKAIIVRSQNLHDIELNPELLAIGRAGAGTNNIPIDKCTERNIVVFNSPGANANAVKELVILSMLLAARNVISGIEFTKSILSEGAKIPEIVEKSKSKFRGVEVRRKKLGVVGLGAIGMMVANSASSIGVEVQGYDPFISVHHAWRLSRAVQPAKNINKLFSNSDFVSLHMPLTEKTREIINADSLTHFRKGAILLNFSRKEIVNEKAVLESLDAGHLGGYITDFPTEALLRNDKVICIPHLGASTQEAEENCALMVVEQIMDYIQNGNIVNSVNFPNCSIERVGESRILITNENIPNMVGQITGALAEAKLNICELLNKSRDSIAYNIVDVDGKVPNDIVEKIRKIDGVKAIRVI